MISIYYRVKAGESLWQIAQRYGADAQKVVRLNHLEKETSLREGMLLRIPIKEPVRPAPVKVQEPEGWITLGEGETLEEAARRAGISRQMLLWLNGLSTGKKPEPGCRLRTRP